VTVRARCATIAFLLGASLVAPAAPDLVARGEELYAESCASCHGADLRGTDRGPSHLSEVYRPDHHADAAFVLAAKQGVRAHHFGFGDMPPVPGLDDDDLTAIVAYVRSVQEREGFEPYPPG
jgi:mono/diheme cytochrome c family protein